MSFRFVFLFGSLMIGAVIFFNVYMQRAWQVKVIFCDARKPVIVNVYSPDPPGTGDISNTGNHAALSSWNGYLNVCELQTIKEIPK